MDAPCSCVCACFCVHCCGDQDLRTSDRMLRSLVFVCAAVYIVVLNHLVQSLSALKQNLCFVPPPPAAPPPPPPPPPPLPSGDPAALRVG